MGFNLEVPLQPKQAEMLELAETSKHTIIGVGGSRGSSKSHGGRAVMLMRRMRYPNTAGAIFRRKMKQIRSNHLENGYFKQYPQMRDWWQEQKRTIALPNGSRIVFLIGEHPTDIDDVQGDEYMDVMVDEAARLTENELVKLNVIRRWTGKFGGRALSDWLCKTFWLMNPGGPGHNYIRRVMYKREYHEKEKAENYKFLQAYAWDNVEWSMSALEERDITVDDYYSWTDQKRFEFFINNTQYGNELNSLPKRLRTGWLLGNWDEFAGQFYDIWDPEKYVRRCTPSKEWTQKWLGIDWGFQHNFSCHWFNRPNIRTSIYREHVDNQKSARAQAMAIVDKTPKEEREQIDAIYLSPDAFQKRSEVDSFAELMGEVFRQYKMPYPIPADDDRVHGAQCMYDLMKDNQLEIDPSCKELINTIPMICTEEDDPQEIQKFDGDDSWDSARYGLKSRQQVTKPPIHEVATTKVQEYATARHKNVEDMDVNTVAQLHRRATAREQVMRARRRGGLGRIWRPQF
jgi:hypothetical protein